MNSFFLAWADFSAILNAANTNFELQLRRRSSELRVTNETKKNSKEQNPAEDELPEMSLDELDNLLAEEDPSFAGEFSKIKDEKFEADLFAEDFAEIDSPPGKNRSRISTFLNNRKTNFIAAVKGIVPYILSNISGFFSALFGSIGSFFKMSLKQKAIILVAVALSALTIVLVFRGLKGSLLPNFELKFLTSFAEVADRSFKINEGDSFEDFDNPLRHPDFVVLIERLVVNLRPSETNESPMGMFEFYVEASSQEGAIEVNERQKEVRDLMARTLEVTSYDDLATAEGKEKAKLNLRRELNSILTQGRVRRVFFKTIILKP